MRELVQALSANAKYAKALEWGKLLTITGSAQLVVQGIASVCGVLVIRLLPTHEYALYTIANTMLGTMVVLADGGVAGSVMAQGGRIWQDRDKLGIVLVTGLDLRKKFALFSLPIAIFILIFLLRYHGAGWLTSILISLSLIPAFVTALSDTILEVVPKLRQDIIPLQKLQMYGSIGRLALLSMSLFVFPWVYIAILAGSLPQLWMNWRLRTMISQYANQDQGPNLLVRSEIMGTVKRRLPEIIYHCVAGQITIWLISIFGSTASVAQAGALGRLAVIITLLNVVFGSLIWPRFARLPNVRSLLFSRYVQIEVGLLIVMMCIIAVVWVFSSQILWILGQEYSSLKTELLLMMTGSCLTFIASSSFYLCAGRNWIIHPGIVISLNIFSIILGIIMIDVSTLKGIIMLNIFVSIINVIIHSTYSLVKIHKVD